jgi:hypothetical protein
MYELSAGVEITSRGIHTDAPAGRTLAATLEPSVQAAATSPLGPIASACHVVPTGWAGSETICKGSQVGAAFAAGTTHRNAQRQAAAEALRPDTHLLYQRLKT